jgi:hypothetical protein
VSEKSFKRLERPLWWWRKKLKNIVTDEEYRQLFKYVDWYNLVPVRNIHGDKIFL